MSKSISPFRRKQTKEFTKRFQRFLWPGLIVIFFGAIVVFVGLSRLDEPLMIKGFVIATIGGALMLFGEKIYEKFLKK